MKDVIWFERATLVTRFRNVAGRQRSDAFGRGAGKEDLHNNLVEAKFFSLSKTCGH
jgi:hypothetical protein